LKKYLKYSLLFFIFCGIIIASYACFVEPLRLVVTSYTVETDKWTSDKPLKIVLLADIHSINPWMTPAHLDKIIEETNKLNPDIVLLLGDYVATHPFGLQIQPDEGVIPLKNLHAGCGAFCYCR
jgi:predicted MPP superfamily phosphohydrolase